MREASAGGFDLHGIYGLVFYVLAIVTYGISVPSGETYSIHCYLIWTYSIHYYHIWTYSTRWWGWVDGSMLVVASVVVGWDASFAFHW